MQKNMFKRFLVGLVALATIATLSQGAYAAVIGTPYTPGTYWDNGPILNQTAATVTSNVLELRELAGMSVQVTHGNVVGTLVLQGSNDNSNFYAVQDVAFAAISGVGGELVDLGNLRAHYFRFVYTHSSGTGTLYVHPYIKGK